MFATRDGISGPSWSGPRTPPSASRNVARRAGELGQNECAPEIDTRGHILLGHQVHAVAQRSDHHHVGRAEQRHQFAAAIRLMQVVDRGYADAPVVAVDPADLPFDVDAQRLIALNAFPAWGGHLHHDRFGYRQPALGEQFAECLDATLDALRVVEPVDAEDDGLRVTKLGADALGTLAYQR